MNIRQKLTFLGLGALLSLGLGVTALVFASGSQLTLSKLSELTQVFGIIKAYYVDEVDEGKLIDDAIDGMLGKLDPHSTFLRPQDYKDLQVSTQGNFGGLGIVVNMNKEGFVEVVSPIDETPAAKAGIQTGDNIVKINDENVKGLTLQQAVERMRGPVGTTLSITILRQDESDLIVHTLTRDTIEIKSVNSRTLEPGYGYIRVNRFQKPTTEQFLENLEDLASAQQLHGLVLDLRNNPGGLLDVAVDISNTFINSGPIVSIRGRTKKSQQQYNAEKGEKIKGVPIVVLINEGSASASEIVAGALQDTGRAIIMGRRSFGKGSVQNVIPLKNSQSGLKITTAKYYTPNGRSIQAEGITPDVIIPRVKVEKLTPLSRVQEKDLLGHLENEQTDEANEDDKKPASKDENAQLDKDYELYQALALLKGIHLNKH